MPYIVIMKVMKGYLNLSPCNFEYQASLTVVMKPELSHQQEVTVEYYEETNIEVKVVAHPKSKVKW